MNCAAVKSLSGVHSCLKIVGEGARSPPHTGIYTHCSSECGGGAPTEKGFCPASPQGPSPGLSFVAREIPLGTFLAAVFGLTIS